MHENKTIAGFLRTGAICVALAIIGVGEARATSAGCTFFAGGQFFANSVTAAYSFETGEILTFSAPAGSVTGVNFVAPGLSPGTTALASGSTARSNQITLTATGSYSLQVTASVGTHVDLVCEDPPEAPAATASETVAATASLIDFSAATLTLHQTTDLVHGRIRAALPGGNFRGLSGNRVGLLSLETERTGAAGGKSSLPLAGWANMSWTAIDRNDEAAPLDQDGLTIAGGIDAFVHKRILLGAAFAASYVESDVPGSIANAEEVSFTIAPYAALVLNDIFTIDMSAGYSKAEADYTFSGLSRTGDTSSDRYFVSANASGLAYFGRLGLEGDIGAFWSQSSQDRYTLSSGFEMEGETSRLGSVYANLKPSLIIYSDGETAIEPFASIGYEYDYALTRIAGAANDRDVLNTGGGVTLFGGGIKGELGVETGLFRENQEYLNLNGTLRVDF